MRLIRLLKNDIAKESAEWVEEDLISQSQAVQICDRYGVDYHQAQRHSFGYNILVGLGYLFIGLAVITLLGANWEDIPRAMRMCGLIALTLTTQGVAIRKYFLGDSAGAAATFALGNLFYGASIILIAQIYHLGEHMPDGVFWWALGCLPISILINSPWVTLQAALLGLFWFWMEVFMGFYPVLFPVFILGSLVVLYRGKQSILLFLTTVASIACWCEYTLAEFWRESRHFDFHAEHVPVSVVLFIFAYSVSHWLGRHPSVTAKDYGAVLSIWSLRFALIFMLVMSFEEPWRELIEAHWEHQFSMYVLIVALCCGSLLLARKTQKLVLATCVLLFYVLSLAAVVLTNHPDHAVYFQVLYNLVLIAVGVRLILKGIHGGISHYFFQGIVTVLFIAFLRYIDLIGDYVGGATLFLLFAGLLLGAAKYWKNVHAKEGVA